MCIDWTAKLENSNETQEKNPYRFFVRRLTHVYGDEKEDGKMPTNMSHMKNHTECRKCEYENELQPQQQ